MYLDNQYIYQEGFKRRKDGRRNQELPEEVDLQRKEQDDEESEELSEMPVR